MPNLYVFSKQHRVLSYMNCAVASGLTVDRTAQTIAGSDGVKHSVLTIEDMDDYYTVHGCVFDKVYVNMSCTTNWGTTLCHGICQALSSLTRPNSFPVFDSLL